MISCDWVLLVQCSVIALSLSRRRFHGIASQFRTPEILLGIGEGGVFPHLVISARHRLDCLDSAQHGPRLVGISHETTTHFS